jgi:hypothetical protein
VLFFEGIQIQSPSQLVCTNDTSAPSEVVAKFLHAQVQKRGKKQRSTTAQPAVANDAGEYEFDAGLAPKSDDDDPDWLAATQRPAARNVSVLYNHLQIKLGHGKCLVSTALLGLAHRTRLLCRQEVWAPDATRSKRRGKHRIARKLKCRHLLPNVHLRRQYQK